MVVVVWVTRNICLRTRTRTVVVGGMVVFCGTTYYHALTGDKQYRRFTPYGGMLLISAWLSMIL